MIITRSPLRVSLGGGGTDLPSYYREQGGGFLIAAAIDKYVYVTILRPFNEGIYLKYSQLEAVRAVSEVKHRIIREALRLQNLKTPQIEITTLADIPAGTGLGSSGSFTTALLKALYAHRRQVILPQELAELAAHIEIDLLGEPIGKQDQYIAAYGGLTRFYFNPDDSVDAKPLNIPIDSLFELEERLCLFFTGFTRSAGDLLKDQKDKSQKRDSDMLQNLRYVKDLGLRSQEALEKGDLFAFGKMMDEHWENKKKRTGGMSNLKIDNSYNVALQNGAVGGKLVGAGGGGFLMFLAEDKTRLRKAMREEGLEELRFKFDFDGAKTVLS
ncbi:MAG: galactokinase [Deltaproteobacteria bacterium]|jgi:D-glycero-alpha-D-manno-heptose-7-phosphate kinase|nr:galactokinase [Deltaproteobacteria bacterium]